MKSALIGLSACAVSIIAAKYVAGQPQPPAQAAGELSHPIVLNVVASPVSENEIAGLPIGSHPEILTWDRAYSLALIRARTRRGAFSPTLDPAALAEEAARHGVNDFARFRANFDGNGPFHDPRRAVLELQGQLLAGSTTHVEMSRSMRASTRCSSTGPRGFRRA